MIHKRSRSKLPSSIRKAAKAESASRTVGQKERPAADMHRIVRDIIEELRDRHPTKTKTIRG